MQPKALKLLDDIRDAAEFIKAVTDDIPPDAYRSNRMLRLIQHDPAMAQRITAHSQIIAFRNLLIHGYDVIDQNVVWGVIRRDIPVLLAEVSVLSAQDEDRM
jgi:uncharacterized protein with HEPN domain